MKCRLDEKFYKANGSIKQWVWIELIKDNEYTEIYRLINLHQLLKHV